MEFFYGLVIGITVGFAGGMYSYYRWGTSLKADVEKIRQLKP